MVTLTELLANRPNTQCDWMDEETPEVFRTKGISYWHWAYSHDGKAYAFYNTKAQAQAALDRRIKNAK